MQGGAHQPAHIVLLRPSVLPVPARYSLPTTSPPPPSPPSVRQAPCATCNAHRGAAHGGFPSAHRWPAPRSIFTAIFTAIGNFAPYPSILVYPTSSRTAFHPTHPSIHPSIHPSSAYFLAAGFFVLWRRLTYRRLYLYYHTPPHHRELTLPSVTSIFKIQGEFLIFSEPAEGG